MLSKKKSSSNQNKSSSQHCALRGIDANFELIDNKLAADQKFARTGQRVFGSESSLPWRGTQSFPKSSATSRRGLHPIRTLRV